MENTLRISEINPLNDIVERLNDEIDRIVSAEKHMSIEQCMTQNNHILAQNKIEEKLKINPDSIGSKLNYGYILIKTGYPKKAQDIYLSIINSEYSSDIKFLAISNYMMCCDYLGILKEKRINIAQYYPKPQGDTPIISDSEKIILGYITSDAFAHPVGTALLKILENHNRDKFEINIFYAGDKLDPIAQKILENCDRMIYIGNSGQPDAISSRDFYNKLRGMKIEILIDLNGHTVGGTRLPLFCKHPCLCNVTMLGYPNSTMLDCFDMRVSSEIVSPNNSGAKYTPWTEPIWNNPYGYMPYFKSLDCCGIEVQNKDKIYIGCISSLAKISTQDIQFYNKLLLLNNNFHLIYARMGTQYSKGKADEIMGQHSEDVKNRIVFLNLGNQPYFKIFEMCDLVLDHTHWSNQMLFQDAYSCGVPAILMDRPGDLPCSMLSRDLNKSLEIELDDSSLLQSMDNRYLNRVSKWYFEKMKSIDTSFQWTRAYEESLIDLFERKKSQLENEWESLPKKRGWEDK
jgi:hypothetical protein